MSDSLTDHFYAMYNSGYQATAIANAIRRNPQAHIDALAEAGVLRSHPEFWIENGEIGTTDAPVMYRVVQPHVHEWQVIEIHSLEGVVQPGVIIACRDCGSRMLISNRLPIEIPDA